MNIEQQKNAMSEWFGERYEDPAQHTPYEGGYIWIYGGPFSAEEILNDNFQDIAKKRALDEVMSDLEGIGDQWTRTPQYDRELHPPEEEEPILNDSATHDSLLIHILKNRIKSLKAISKKFIKTDIGDEAFGEMMTFSFCITLMENYFSDIFIRIVLKSSDSKKNFLKKDKDFSREKISYGELYDTYENLDKIIKQRLNKISFHNIASIKSLFSSVLGVNVVGLEQLAKFIEKRHDFVHRAGKNVDGVFVSTNQREVGVLANRIEKICTALNATLIKKGYIKESAF